MTQKAACDDKYQFNYQFQVDPFVLSMLWREWFFFNFIYSPRKKQRGTQKSWLCAPLVNIEFVAEISRKTRRKIVAQKWLNCVIGIFPRFFFTLEWLSMEFFLQKGKDPLRVEIQLLKIIKGKVCVFRGCLECAFYAIVVAA